MSLTKKIARATQNNYRLNCRVLKMKCSWDEVQSILDTACRKKRGCCRSSSHSPCEQPQVSCPKPVKQNSCEKENNIKEQKCHDKSHNKNCNGKACHVNPRSPFYPFF